MFYRGPVLSSEFEEQNRDNGTVVEDVRESKEDEAVVEVTEVLDEVDLDARLKKEKRKRKREEAGQDADGRKRRKREKKEKSRKDKGKAKVSDADAEEISSSTVEHPAPTSDTLDAEKIAKAERKRQRAEKRARKEEKRRRKEVAKASAKEGSEEADERTGEDASAGVTTATSETKHLRPKDDSKERKRRKGGQ